MVSRKKKTEPSELEQLELLGHKKTHIELPISSFTPEQIALLHKSGFFSNPSEDEEVEEEETEEEGVVVDEATAAGTPPMIYSDKYIVVSNAFESSAIRGIELPKMIFRKVREGEQTVQEKSAIMVYLDVTQENIKAGLFKRLHKAASQGDIDLEIKWLSETDMSASNPSPLSHWKFFGAKIHGIDFGNMMAKRPDINMVSIEISYASLSIDGIHI